MPLLNSIDLETKLREIPIEVVMKLHSTLELRKVLTQAVVLGPVYQTDLVTMRERQNQLRKRRRLHLTNMLLRVNLEVTNLVELIRSMVKIRVDPLV